MIKIYEQYGFRKEDRCLSELEPECRKKLDKTRHYTNYVRRGRNSQSCYEIYFDENDQDFHFITSYFVGVDWIENNLISIYVQPKQNNESVEVNYIGMLLEALQDPANLGHLDDLLHIKFNEPYIYIEQKEDILSPFLVAQFLQIVRRIVQKGLKKSYYSQTENINSRIKGKILTGQNIKQNISRGRITYSVCKYQEYGFNCDENKILKKAYEYSRRVIGQYANRMDTGPLTNLTTFIRPAFEKVSDDIDIKALKTFRPNPLFKEYDQAIKLALLILKRFSYNITQTEQKRVSTPPFWIDMSKLFELYVFKKLRDVFPGKERIIYHPHFRSKEVDFLINCPEKNIKMVVDAKYKPRYKNSTIDIADYRQISGYARLKRVYKSLGIDISQSIDCLIIYPDTDAEQEIDIRRKEESSEYSKIYRIGVGIPLSEN